MNKISTICKEKFGPFSLALLRVVIGLIFLDQGIFKLINMPITIGLVTGIGFPYPVIFAWILALAETICGAMIVLGLFTGLAVIPLLIDMAVAFITIHLKTGLYGLQALPGWLEILLFFALLALGCNGWKFNDFDKITTKKAKK